MSDSIVCDECQTEIPLRDVVIRYMRMREVAPDTKVSAVACPTCLQAIPLTAEQFDAVRTSAQRASDAIDSVGDAHDDDPRSRHAALLLLLAHELGLTPGSCAEEHIVVRVRELVADDRITRALIARIRKQRDTSNGTALRLEQASANAAATRGLHGQAGASPTVAEHRAVAQAMQALLMFTKSAKSASAPTDDPSDQPDDEEEGVLPS